MALHLPMVPLKTFYGLDLVQRCEPVPTSSLADDLATMLWWPVDHYNSKYQELELSNYCTHLLNFPWM